MSSSHSQGLHDVQSLLAWVLICSTLSKRPPILPGAGRFNERLVLSLASNPACLLMDDELNILPTSSHVSRIQPIPLTEDGLPDVPGAGGSAAELKELVESLKETQARAWPPRLFVIRQPPRSMTCHVGSFARTGHDSAVVARCCQPAANKAAMRSVAVTVLTQTSNVCLAGNASYKGCTAFQAGTADACMQFQIQLADVVLACA